jgi:hypothetical protein
MLHCRDSVLTHVARLERYNMSHCVGCHEPKWPEFEFSLK